MKWVVYSENFWRNVSNATEARTPTLGRQFEDNAMRAFAEIYSGCAYDSSHDDPAPEISAMHILRQMPSEDPDVLVDVGSYMPPDIIDRGMRLADLSMSYYVI